MGLFGNKKTPEQEAAERAAEVKKKEIADVVRMSEVKFPTKNISVPYGREYKSFLHDIEKKPKTKFEKLCKSAESLGLDISGEEKFKMEQSLTAAYINATTKGVFSLAILLGLTLSIVSIFLLFLGVGTLMGMMFLGFSIGVAAYIYRYPNVRGRVMELRMSADTVLAILYMVVYMRSSPNLEGALKFAAENLEGPLSWDIKKLVWDIEVGKYSSADSALKDYVNRWKDKNSEFAEALHLLMGSAVEADRREMIYDETINVILNGTKERTKHYAAGLRMPMMLIDSMGILLPVMGLVLFPVVIIFMGDAVKPIFIFVGYDVLLPLALWFMSDYILQTKPPTFSQPDISKARGIPPLGKLKIGKTLYDVWPFAILAALPLLIIGLSGMSSPDTVTSVNYSLMIILSIAVGISAYCYLDAMQKAKVRADIEKIEDEFSVALFQLGNKISGGEPIEIAVDKAIVELRDLKIAEMFRIVSFNMRRFGYTFEQAMFDKDIGAIWNYPSKLIHSIMNSISETSKKSVMSAADSMITISEYLKGVHQVKEEIEEILGETISSMRFLSMFLAPMVAGVTVTMAIIIIQILVTMGGQMSSLIGAQGANSNVAAAMFTMPWAMSGQVPISPVAFQLVVGIYMIETAIILSILLNSVRYGDDAIGARKTLSTTLIVSIIVYIVSWFVTYSMFGPTISVLLSPVQG